MNSAQAILSVLDASCESHKFPMLDNGYVYPAAARLSLFRSEIDWALVLELFGFSPRAGEAELSVTTFASRLVNRDPPTKYATREAYETYLTRNPNNEVRFYCPLQGSSWRDEDDVEVLSKNPDAAYVLRGQVRRVPTRDEYFDSGIQLANAETIYSYELCRYVASLYRDEALATPAERRASVPDELQQLLVMEDWWHPDIARGERPSQTRSFRDAAEILATGNVSTCREVGGNTHWSNWPEGGTQ